MRKFVIMFIALLLSFAGEYLVSAPKIQYNIESGKYVPSISVTIGNLRNMPVPSGNQDYALLQCIGTEVNIVAGSFSKGEREIVLYKDTNSDGKIEFAVHWFVDRKVPRYEPKPEEFCPPEKFRKMKEDIIMGRQGDIFPNSEGLEYLQALIKNSENIKKWQKGFIVTKMDLDDPTVERVKYSFSDNGVNGVDIVFDVVYVDRGVVKESPVINQGVYCKGSKEPFMTEIAKRLLNETSKYYISSR